MSKNMTSRHKSILLTSFVILMAVVFTIPFVFEFTLAGPPEAPDRTAVYTQNKITWSDGTTSKDSNFATLGLFGESSETDIPVINPESNDTYRLRFVNKVQGSVNCFLYIYCENPHGVPLKFEVDPVEGMSRVIQRDYPDLGDDVTMLYAAEGRVHSKGIKDFIINWAWDSVSDTNDTELGVKAGNEDVTYTIKVMLVVEDYNRYGNGANAGLSWGGGNGMFLRHSKYVYGYTDGTFRPDNLVTRAEVAAFLSRMVDTTMLPASGENVLFSDVHDGHWATPAIRELSRCGVISGYPDGTFRPEASISRAEFASLCVRLLERTSHKTFPTAKLYFADLDSSHWSYEWVSKAVADGIITGYEDDTFRADAGLTRAEAVSITNRMLWRFPDREAINKKATTGLCFSDVIDTNFWAYYDIYEASYTHYYYMDDGAEKWVDLQ